ncbi:MAG: hypothetical protein ACO3I0_13540, partial [Limisphaerales bacterium]
MICPAFGAKCWDCVVDRDPKSPVLSWNRALLRVEAFLYITCLEAASTSSDSRPDLDRSRTGDPNIRLRV